MKVVINRCFGGFGLSEQAILWLAERGSDAIETDTLEEYYGADENGMVEELDFTSRGGTKRRLVPVAEYHANRRKDSFCPPVEFQGKIVGYRDQIEDMDDYDEGRAIMRRHPDLIAVVEELGAAANGPHAALAVVEIPDGVEYSISEYDGIEHIAEKHRTWH